jgi:hypothetical protein
MSMLSSAVQRSTLRLHTLEQYETLVAAATIERIAAKADRVRTMRVPHQFDVLWRWRHRTADAANYDDECSRHRNGLAF